MKAISAIVLIVLVLMAVIAAIVPEGAELFASYLMNVLSVVTGIALFVTLYVMFSEKKE